jgi:hypothetical protein
MVWSDCPEARILTENARKAVTAHLARQAASLGFRQIFRDLRQCECPDATTKAFSFETGLCKLSLRLTDLVQPEAFGEAKIVKKHHELLRNTKHSKHSTYGGPH